MTVAELKKFRSSVKTATVFHYENRGYTISFESSFKMFNHSQLETARDQIRYFKTLDAAFKFLKDNEFQTFTVNTVSIL